MRPRSAWPRGLCRARERGDHPPDRPAAGAVLAAGQALDHQSRPGVRPKKGQRDRLIAVAQAHPDWVLGLPMRPGGAARAPRLQAWTEPADGPLRLIEQDAPKGDPDPKALACYGVLLPSSGVPSAAGCALSMAGRSALSRTVPGLVLHAVGGGREAGVAVDMGQCLLAREQSGASRSGRTTARSSARGRACGSCVLPVKTPWLNPIEPKWVHGKRAIAEPARLLSAHEVADRVCAHFGCSHDAHPKLFPTRRPDHALGPCWLMAPPTPMPHQTTVTSCLDPERLLLDNHRGHGHWFALAADNAITQFVAWIGAVVNLASSLVIPGSNSGACHMHDQRLVDVYCLASAWRYSCLKMRQIARVIQRSVLILL